MSTTTLHMFLWSNRIIFIGYSSYLELCIRSIVIISFPVVAVILFSELINGHGHVIISMPALF